MNLKDYDHQDLVYQAVARLSVHLLSGKGLSHPLDISRAKGLFKALANRGVEFNNQEIAQVAVHQFRWDVDHAIELGELAVKISNGSQVQNANMEAGNHMADRMLELLSQS